MFFKKLIIFLPLIFFSCLYPYSIVFVHIGKNIPSYLYDAIEQSRLFNKNCDIYLLANKNSVKNTELKKLNKCSTIVIELESLIKTEEHSEFLKKTILDKEFRDGFWLYTCERFLYLNDFIQQYHLTNIIHLESDNMVYVNFGELLPIFEYNYKGIALVLDNDERCIPGLVFLSDSKIMKELAQCFVKHTPSGKNDMQILAMFYQEKSESKIVDTLPIIMPEYVKSFGLSSTAGHRTTEPSRYYNHIEKFKSIFDGAAIGQYLGGIDPRNGQSKPGFINESCLFNPSLLKFEWKKDHEERKIPYAIFKGQCYRINNLHIHSKNLKRFFSK